jgi:hypothetical protein
METMIAGLRARTGAYFYCAVEGGELVMREMAALKAADGWFAATSGWTSG